MMKKYNNVVLETFINKKPFPEDENIYETQCPTLYAMDLSGQKWKLPILWYMAEAGIRLQSGGGTDETIRTKGE